MFVIKEIDFKYTLLLVSCPVFKKSRLHNFHKWIKMLLLYFFSLEEYVSDMNHLSLNSGKTQMKKIWVKCFGWGVVFPHISLPVHAFHLYLCLITLLSLSTKLCICVDRGAWWATVHRVIKSQMQLKQLSIQHTHVYHMFLIHSPMDGCKLLPHLGYCK